MDSGFWALISLVVGLALIVAEVFVPSAGMISIMALLAFAFSIWSAWIAWWDKSPTLFAGYLASLCVLIPLAVSGAFYILPRTPIGRVVLAEPPKLSEVTPYQAEQRELERYVGHLGQTITLLNPGGLVLIDGHRHHCESEGLLIESGSAVEIVAVKGNRVVVRPVDARVNEDNRESRLAEGGESGTLDFDLPQT